MRFLIKVTVCCALVCATGAATAAASTAPRTLSQPEYQQLQSLFGRLNAVKGTSPAAFKRKESVCRHTKSVSALVSAEKTNCLDAVAIAVATRGVEAVVKRCDAKSTTAASLNCLIPSYRHFYRSLENEFLIVSRLEHIDKTRGFNAGCVEILGGDAKGVQSIHRLARDAGQVLSNLRSHNITKLHAAEDRLFAAENDSTGITSAHGSLASCTQAL
jgi:hypothetical protein